jgi:signal transduction histidine kinase/ABC-type amino acid transport substrate-binding protein/ActR/RegA family two-component response regulator
VLLCLLGLLATGTAQGQSDAIMASGGEGYSPYHFVDKGQSVGFDVDLLRAVAAATGMQVEVDLKPWQEARSGLDDGTIQVHVGMTISNQRRSQFLFTTPHLSQQYRIFIREDDSRIRNQEDLAGKRLVVQRGGVMANYVLDKGYTVSPIEVDSAVEALQMVAEGKGDATLMSELRGLYVAQEADLDNLVRVGDPVYQTSYSFAVNKSRPDLVPRLNQGLAIVKASGEYNELYDKWFGVLDDRRVGLADVLHYALWVILPLAGLAILTGLWTWSLRRQVARQTVALEKALDAAEAASRAKSRFLATMSHEVRTPLNGVLGMAQVLAISELDEDQRDQLTTITQSGEALEAILSGILEFSRLEQGERELETTPFCPGEMLTQAAELVRLAAIDKGLDLRLEGLNDLPGLVEGDAGGLRQVVLNLLSNGVKFTEEGWVGLFVGIKDREEDRGVLTLRVEDTGIGFRSEDQDYIFEAFTQSDSSDTRRFGGMGLGLAISRSLVELMGGTLHLNPRAGGGSVFHFQIPVTVLPEEEEAESRPQVEEWTEEVADAWSAAGLRVLLVEDNPLNQRVMCLLLEQENVQMTLARNGREALDAWSPGAFDAILMDCQMPEMDGFQATTELRKQEPGDSRVPIIALTAGAFDSDREHCLEVGMDDYLTKPVDGELLFATLRRWDRREAVVAEGVLTP